MTTGLPCPQFWDGRGCGHYEPVNGDEGAARERLRNHLRGLHGGVVWEEAEVRRSVGHVRPRPLETLARQVEEARRKHLARRGR
ncbi:hypothetical protein [Streptomyces sp. NPDC090021]|uniref:hypothetical protein n=1 Tax=Streptomyces sp. NPDC090021 TaxID=3365919 RepID=UPI00382C425B